MSVCKSLKLKGHPSKSNQIQPPIQIRPWNILIPLKINGLGQKIRKVSHFLIVIFQICDIICIDPPRGCFRESFWRWGYNHNFLITVMKKTVLFALCLGCVSAATASRAIDLKQSKITQVVNDVQIISATDQSEKTAS